MSTRVITQEECEVVNNVVSGFVRKMKRNPRWEEDDIRQELLIYWFQKKQNGWTKPEEWKGAMGRCLSTYLISLRRKECAQKRHAEGSMLSFEQLIEDGQEFSDQRPKPISLEFLAHLNKQEQMICELLLDGKTKTEIPVLLKRSRTYVDRRIQHIRTVLKNYFLK